MHLPEGDALSAIVGRFALLLSQVGTAAGERPLVLPTAEFFPDAFRRDEASVAALVDRMLCHAGMDDVPVVARVISTAAPEATHDGCGSGCAVPVASAALPRLVDGGDEWTLNVPEQELSHPTVLTTAIARALGYVFLVETLPDGAVIEPPADLSADHAAVVLGFGALLLEGAHIYSKGCGGPQVATCTRASVEELAVLCALFVEMGKHSSRRVLREMPATQEALLAEACEWARSNAALVERLRKDPARVAAGDFSVEPVRPWLLRLLGKKPQEGSARPVPRRASAPDPERDELRALVDDALANR